MSLKRHPALQPFSRDHVVGLYHAHQLMWLSQERARCDLETTVRNFQQAWEAELITHFAGEEELLSELSIGQTGKDKLFSDHNELRVLCPKLFDTAAPDLQLCYDTGHKLEQHIRWEEHEFFPEIESSLSEAQLALLSTRTKEFERERMRSL